MNNELKTSLPKKKTLLLISIFSLICAAISCFLGELTLGMVAGLLAALYLLEGGSRRPFSIITSLAVICFNVVGFVLGYTCSLFAPVSVILAVIIYCAYIKRANKAEIAFVMTVVAALFSVGGFCLLAMAEQGEYTASAVTSYYGELFATLRETFVSAALEMYSEAYASAGIILSAEDVGAIFDSQLNMIISYIIILAFLGVGIGMKVFCAVVAKYSEDSSGVLSWRFVTSNVFAYFFIALALVSVFTEPYTGIFAVSVANLYNVFNIVYVYVGFSFINAVLSKRMKPVFSFLILILILLMLSSLAMMLLAVVGVYYTVSQNKGRIYPGKQ